jgi:hypothetical protein
VKLNISGVTIKNDEVIIEMIPPEHKLRDANKSNINESTIREIIINPNTKNELFKSWNGRNRESKRINKAKGNAK